MPNLNEPPKCLSGDSAIAWVEALSEGEERQEPVSEAQAAQSRLDPGVYELSESVVNPCPDRRARHDWRLQPIWMMYSRFVVSHWSPRDDRSVTVEVRLVGAVHAMGEHEWNGRFEALTAKLVPSKARTAQEVIEASPCGGYPAAGVLEQLFSDGVVSDARILEALRRMHEVCAPIVSAAP